jgi:MscS family membrane protein
MRWWRPTILLLCLLAIAATAPAQDAPPAETDAAETVAPATPDVPRELADPALLPERFLEEFENYRRDPTASIDPLLKYLPARDRNAFDKAGARAAERFGDVLRDCREDGRVTPPFVTDDERAAGNRVAWSVRDPNWAVLELPIVREPDGAWRFSPEAIDNAVARHATLNPEQYFLRNVFERMGLKRLVDEGAVGLKYYQWVSLFVLIFAGVLLDFVVRVSVALVTRRYLRRDEDSVTETDTRALIRRSARPFGLLAGGALVYLALPLVELPTRIDGILRTAALVYAMIAGQFAAFRVVDLVGEWFNRRAIRTATKVDDLLIPLIRKAVKVFLLAFGLIFIAESLNLPVTSLLAGFGIAGAAFAFASKDTVENLFGSVAVILDRPFHQGDWVVINDVEGTVEELGFRSTRIRTFYNSLVSVPNAVLVRATVDNYGRRRYRRFKTVLSLTYGTPPDKVEAFCEGIRELIRRGEHTRKDMFEIHMNSFGPASLDVLVYMFFRVPDWSTELRARHAFCLDILRLARELGVEFAFPTQTIHMAGDAPAAGETPPRLSADDAQDEGRDAAMAVLRGAPG